MAIPRRGSRRITVEGWTYRYRGVFCERDRIEGLEVNELHAHLDDSSGSVLRAEFSYERLNREYARVGQHVSRWLDSLPPYVVRGAILVARARGWNPDQPGPLFDLGCLDDAIDWSGLKPQPPTRQR